MKISNLMYLIGFSLTFPAIFWFMYLLVSKLVEIIPTIVIDPAILVWIMLLVGIWVMIFATGFASRGK